MSLTQAMYLVYIYALSLQFAFRHLTLIVTRNVSFFAKGDAIKVNKAFSGRVTMPGYAANPLNATMEISGLRTNDSGTYRCQVVMGNEYERDAAPLVVSGKCSNR